MKKNRDILDITKFGMSLLIVALHSQLLDPYLFPCLRIAVPVFFILTGFLTFTKLNTSDNYPDKLKLLKGTIVRYLKLYFFWFVVLLPFTLYIRKYFQNGFVSGIFKMVKSFLFGSTFSASWYLMASIIGLYIIFWLSKKFSNKILLLITIPIYLISTFCSEFSVLITEIPVLNTMYNFYYNIFGDPFFSFPIALLYLVLGKIIADYKFDDNRGTNLNNIILFFVSLILLMFEYNFISKKHYFVYNCDCLIMLAPVALFFVLSIINIKIKINGAKIFRNLSTIVYCIHVPVITIISKTFEMIGFADYMNMTVFLVSCFVCILVGIFILNMEKNKKFRFLKYSH